MKVMKIIAFLSVLVIATVLAQEAAALPNSTFVDGDGKSWEGHKTYDEVYVEWAVYNIAENPWAADVTFPAGNDYIYAYQIANLGADPIESFYLLEAFGGSQIDWTSRAAGTQAVDDTLHDADIMPVLPSENEAQWNWSPIDGTGFITTNGYSAFLVFSSPYAPIAGGFEVVRSTDEGDTPIPDVPEPGSIALLGVASTWLIANRRKKRQTA
ncbi:MAG: PEP-CTERM sorting domain-containing protein [Planctomycetota bacterium]